MPRPVNPERHRARRLQIIDGAMTALATHGYAGATTSAICRSAGVGSGTFFHYFPTKEAVVVAILEEGTAETQQFFSAQEERDDALGVVLDYVSQVIADFRDPRAAGFIAAGVGSVANERIAAALIADEQAARDGLLHWIARARQRSEVRPDLTDQRLAEWIQLLLDGFAMRISASADFDVDAEGVILLEQVRYLVGTQHPPHL